MRDRSPWDILLDKIEEQRKSRADDMTAGKIESFADYKHEAGYIAALDFVLNELDQLGHGNFGEGTDR